MVISGLVVETAREYTAQVAEILAATGGVEVHKAVDYKLAVTIEAETVDASYAIASSFVGITGVLGVSLVYANFEEDPSIAWPLASTAAGCPESALVEDRPGEGSAG